MEQDVVIVGTHSSLLTWFSSTNYSLEQVVVIVGTHSTITLVVRPLLGTHSQKCLYIYFYIVNVLGH